MESSRDAESIPQYSLPMILFMFAWPTAWYMLLIYVLAQPFVPESGPIATWLFLTIIVLGTGSEGVVGLIMLRREGYRLTLDSLRERIRWQWPKSWKAWGIALLVLILATWTTNVANLYGAGLAARASVPIGNYKWMVIVGGIVGTIAALGGIADNLIDFLIVLGLLVPPIAGVYLCDFFLLRRTDFSAEHLEHRPAIKVNALIAGIGSGVLATWMYYSDSSLTSIASFDSLLISIVVYLVLEKGSAMMKKK